jgi:hypothetical protein
MQEYAFLFLCFCQKVQFDMNKYLTLLKMAKKGAHAPPIQKNMTVRIVMNDKERESYCHF